MKRALLLATAILLLLPVSQVCAAPKPYYDGKIIKLIVPTKPGGGYDFYGRMLANYMEKKLPGSTIIVRNIPGAGHIIGTNEMYHADPDGLTFAIFNPGVITAQLVGQKGVNFDVTKMSWIGATGIADYSFVVNPKKFKTLEDVKKAKQVLLSSAGLSSLSHVMPALFMEISGFNNLKLLTGYGGTEAEMAMIRGDLDGQFGSWNSLSSFVADGNGVPVMFIGGHPKGFENVPLLQDVVTDPKYEPMVNFMESIASTLNRPFAGPPGIPPERLEILRNAFKEVVNDTQFLEAMRKAERPAGYLGPQKCEAMMKSFEKISPDMIALIKNAYGIKD